ncbi:MAG: LPS-assembly protein LptD [Rhodospirillales bacterium]|nr:LPS-assembly protein LptD [Rhodospirillales bacterium]
MSIRIRKARIARRLSRRQPLPIVARGAAQRRILAVGLFTAVGLATAAPSPAAAIEPFAMNQAVEFQADELTYDSATKVIHATGNVVAVQNNRRLIADSMTYDELNNRVTADGHATLFEPSGEVIHAQTFDVTADLKNGIIEDMRAVLADGSRVTAKHGERHDGDITTMTDATYTPCLPCAKDPSRTPLWQVRAVKVTHDQEDKIVEFSHSWLDFSGVPVFYIPYFYQPDPTVKRKSGLLIPSFGETSDLGFVAKIPYFAVLSDQQDLTITPWLTTQEGPVLEMRYRQALQHGTIDFDGSGTYDTDQRARGHVMGEARYDIDDTWRGGLDVQRATDRTYLRRYNFNSQRTLTTRLFAEDFIGNNDYFTGNAIAFQDLDQDIEQSDVPYVAPWLDYYHSGDMDRFGGYTDLHLDAAALTRETGTDTRRMSARAQWQRPFVGPIGDLMTVSTAIWGDGYNVNDQTTSERDNDFNGFSGRVFPQASAQWRLPLVREGSIQQVIEPIGELVLAPNFGNPSRIPNEDSQDFELRDTNLFGFDRLPGIDLVDEGSRVNYGLNWSGTDIDGRRASAFVGQSYSFFDDHTFGPGTGLQDKVSDVVGSLDLVPTPWLDLLYRTRLDHNSLDMRRNELTARFGVDALRLKTTYVRYDGQPQNDLEGSQEAQYALDSQLTRYWSGRIYGITDIDAESQREIGLRAVYEDDCFVFSADIARQNFKDKDVEPSNVIFFRVGFKTLGDIGGGVNAGGG